MKDRTALILIIGGGVLCIYFGFLIIGSFESYDGGMGWGFILYGFGMLAIAIGFIIHKEFSELIKADHEGGY